MSLNKQLTEKNYPEEHEMRQDAYHYLSLVGFWKVQCEQRRVDPGFYGAPPPPPVGLLEESIWYGEHCDEDGPQSPLVIQALTKLVEMYANSRDYMKAELTSLRLQAVEERRKVNMQIDS